MLGERLPLNLFQHLRVLRWLLFKLILLATALGTNFKLVEERVFLIRGLLLVNFILAVKARISVIGTRKIGSLRRAQPATSVVLSVRFHACLLNFRSALQVIERRREACGASLAPLVALLRLLLVLVLEGRESVLKVEGCRSLLHREDRGLRFHLEPRREIFTLLRRMISERVEV